MEFGATQIIVIAICSFAVVLALFRHYLLQTTTVRKSTGVHKYSIIEMTHTGFKEINNDVIISLTGTHPETNEPIIIDHVLPDYTRENQGEDIIQSIEEYYNFEENPIIEVRVKNTVEGDYLIVDPRF